MKRLVAALGLVCVLAAPAFAQTSASQIYLDQGVFTWADGGGGATSYTIKCGSQSGGPYTRIIPLPRSPLQAIATQVFGGPDNSKWFCVVTASSANGESGPSNEITFTLRTRAYHYNVF